MIERSGGSRSIDAFHPLVRDWFVGRFGDPTPIQNEAWPRIRNGEHVLVTAPTGSGKTLTAFLAAINTIVDGRAPSGTTSVLYVSPLKALNNDIRRNLLGPLAELRELAAMRELPFPQISVATRSGDTPSAERRRMLAHPPEILITTPESLNIILSSPRARAILSTVQTVILDEIHAVVDSKRGTHLMTAVERVGLLAGEFQRIAVSATVKPLDLVADFVGGFVLDEGTGEDATYRAREVAVVGAPDTKRIELVVDFPDTDEQLEPGSPEGLWPHLVRELRSIVDRNRSTLIFVTTRRHAEKLTLLLNEGLEKPIAYSHHGSLSRELRYYVEQALKDGELKAIVATNSLELGIDIGSLDEVLMVKTPMTVSSTLQRIGRAGHSVGMTSRGTLFPIYGRDMVDAAAMASATLERDIEAVRPVVAPLDILAQIIVSMTAMDRWRIDDLYAVVRTSWPYRRLERRHFDLVLEMLAGRYAETRIRELRPRVSIDRVCGEVAAREGMTALLYQSGGTIPDRGYYSLRLSGGGAVGELDEEFVWERRVGETFVFGAQTWTITAITDRDVLVVPAGPGANAIPFWRAESRGRDAHYSRRLLVFLESCETAIASGSIETFLAESSHLSARVRERIVDLLDRQRAATGTALPHIRHIVVENVRGAPRSRADADVQEVIVHSGWGGRVNRPLAIALAALWEREYGYALEVYADDDCLVLLLPAEFAAEDAFGPARCRELLHRGALETLLRERLERSGTFGALFRENAGRALLLPRGSFTKRMPLWLNRLRSKKLLASVSGFADFPILLETWRTCLSDEFDLPALREMLEGVSSGEIALSTCETTGPSPFAAEMVRQQTNLHMYQDDSLPGGARSNLGDNLIREAIMSDALRPRIPRDVVERVEERLARLAPGYAPDGPQEILEWVTERLALPSDEVAALRDAVIRDHGEAGWSIAGLEPRLTWIAARDRFLLTSVDRLPSLVALHPGATAYRAHGETWWLPPTPGGAGTSAGEPVAHLARRLGYDPAAQPAPGESLLELLRFCGPVLMSDAGARLGLDQARWVDLVATLHAEDLVVVGEITEGATEQEVCDAETLEYLLRVRRAADIIPARLDEYYPLWLDGLFGDHDLIWMGAGPRRLLFCLSSDARLFSPDPTGETHDGAAVSDHDAARLIADALAADGPADFFTLRDRLDLPSDELTGRLWEASWKGTVGNDSFQTVRAGLATQFTASAVESSPRPGSRWPGRRGRSAGKEWRATRPLAGTWFAIESEPAEHPADQPAHDPIAATERERERARILLRRYGVVFRDLVTREAGAFAWRGLFRALRLMELAGEVVSGVFVEDVPSPQFALRSAIDLLQRAQKSTRIVWMSAMDPASPCGLSLGPHFDDLPSRLPGNHVVFRGPHLVLVSRRNGRLLSFTVPPDDPDLRAILAPLRSMVTRRWNPRSRVVVESVNELPVRESPYASALRAAGFRDEFRSYVLCAPYR